MKIIDYIKNDIEGNHYEIYIGNPFDINTDRIKFLLSDYSDSCAIDEVGITKDNLMNYEIDPTQVNLMDEDEYNSTIYANSCELAQKEDMPTLVIILRDDDIEELLTYYSVAVISPDTDDPEEYQIGKYNDKKWNCYDDLIKEIKKTAFKQGAEIYILGEDDLPSKIDDIRGSVDAEPEIIYVSKTADGHIQYNGISSFRE